MRKIKAEVNYKINDDGSIQMSCSVPLTDDEVDEFRRVLAQGSTFLDPTIDGNTIHYSLLEKYNSKKEADKIVENRVKLFHMSVRSRTELTLSCDLTLNVIQKYD